MIQFCGEKGKRGRLDKLVDPHRPHQEIKIKSSHVKIKEKKYYKLFFICKEGL